VTIFGARRGERRYNRRATGDLAVRLLLGSKLLSYRFCSCQLMIADRVCFVHDLRMKRLRLVSMLGDPTPAVGSPVTPAMWNCSSSRKRNHCLLRLVLALPTSAADRAEEVRATEIAFAKAFADRDAKKFFLYLADDAQFLGRRNTMHGKQEVIVGWSEFFKPAVAPFRWQPERVVTNAAGDLGFSSGPVFDEAGVQISTFTSTWVRQPDGSWKILFDGGSACPTTKQSAQ
jgi:ketosteroid isomerase-like protein